jgi:hypothetical protein
MTDCDSSEIWAIGFCKKHYAQNYHRINYEQTRRGCLAAYGGYCRCCGESDPAFLVIDHIAGGGNQHRKSIGNASKAFYHWLRNNGYPPGFQVLCANCNTAKSRPGGCPHQDGLREVSEWMETCGPSEHAWLA